MRALLNNLSIRGKLSAIILVVSLFLLLLTSIGLIINEYKSLEKNLETDLFALATIINSNSTSGLAFNDDRLVVDVLSSLAVKTNITEAHVFTMEGKLFASYYRKDAKHVEGINNNFIQRYFADTQNKPLMNLAELQDSFTAHDNHVNVFSKIIQEQNPIGVLFIQSDLTGFQQRLYLYIVTVFGVMFISLILTSLLAGYLQNIITQPVYNLLHVMTTVTREKNYTLRAPKTVNDEIGKLIDGFNEMLANIAARDQEIRILNKQLTEENSRMGAELDITRRLQQMVLPTTNELQQVEGLDIAGFMEPADEVGGDYYDVLQHDGRVKIGIGDVTGHGLESGVVMLMVQMAVRTLLTNNVTDPKAFLTILNRAVFDNVHRMQSDKNLTLTLLDYEAGVLRFVGQHEDILLVRQNGKVECIDTLNLGFMVGLVREISDFLVSEELNLAIGEGIVLYTDGITEARDDEGNLFGLERLCDVIQAHWQLSAKKIQQAIISDVLRHINGYKITDDITLLVIKRMA